MFFLLSWINNGNFQRLPNGEQCTYNAIREKRNEKISLRNNRFHTFFSLSFLQLVLQTQSTHQEASQQRRKLQEQSCKWLVWLTSTKFQLEVCFVSYFLNWLTGNKWLAVSVHFKNSRANVMPMFQIFPIAYSVR